MGWPSWVDGSTKAPAFAYIAASSSPARAEHNHARRPARRRFDGARVFAVVVGAADQRELPVGRAELGEGVDQVELALLLVDARHGEQVAPRCETEMVEDRVRARRARR